MTKVTVYQYIILDPGPVERRKSRRWGTRQAIDALKDAADIIEDSATEVDEAVLNAGGFTGLDFDPRRSA